MLLYIRETKLSFPGVEAIMFCAVAGLILAMRDLIDWEISRDFPLKISTGGVIMFLSKISLPSKCDTSVVKMIGSIPYFGKNLANLTARVVPTTFSGENQ